MKKINLLNFLILFVFLILFSSLVFAHSLIPSGKVFGYYANESNVTINLYNSSGDFIAQEFATMTIIDSNESAYTVPFHGLDVSTDYRLDIYSESHGANGFISINVTTGASELEPTFSYANLTLFYNFILYAPLSGDYTGNRTEFNWSIDAPDANNFTIVIDDDSDLSSPERIINIGSTNSYTLTLVESLPDGLYYVKINAFDNSIFIQNTSVVSFNVMEGAVVLYDFSPSSSIWFNGMMQTLSFNTTGNAICKFNQANDSSYSAKTELDITNGTYHETTVFLMSQGQNWFYIQCNNSINGVVSGEVDYPILFDNINPSIGSVDVDFGAIYSFDVNLDFNWSGFSDASSGISNYYYSFSDNGGSSSGTFDASSPGSLNGASQGNVNVYVWAEDYAGNIGFSAYDSIIVDTLPPAFSNGIWTAINKISTSDLEIRVTVTDSSPLSGGVPVLSYNKFGGNYSSYQAMTLESGSITTGAVFLYTIPQAPDDWSDHEWENVSFIINATDIHNMSSVYTGYETVEATITPPIFYPINDIVANQGDSINFTLIGHDPDGDRIYFSCNYGTVTSINDSVSRGFWSPSAEDVGNFSVNCIATDQTHNVSQNFNIEIKNMNDAPVLSTTLDENYLAYTYELFNLTLNVTDIDNDDILFSTNSSYFSIDQDGEIRTIPSLNSKGIHKINISFSDGKGGDSSVVITITVLSCGDGVCSENFESCSSCEQDCGCPIDESSALVIYPRNCLDNEMVVQAVNLVERATCETPGAIIDGKEVCGNLSQEEILVEHMINDSYEEIGNYVTDEFGIVRFLLTTEGDYRLSMGDVVSSFSTHECYSSDSLEESKEIEKPKKTPSTIKNIERPEELDIERPKSNLFRIILLFIVLVLVVGSYAVRFEYAREMKIGKDTALINFVNNLGAFWNKIKEKIILWVENNEVASYIVDQIVIYKERVNQKFSKLKVLILSFKPKKKPKHFDIPFFSGVGMNFEKVSLLILLSAQKHIFRLRKNIDIVNKMRARGNIKSFVDMVKVSKIYNVKVNYWSVNASLELEKEGILVDVGEKTLEELFKNLSRSSSIIVELVFFENEKMKRQSFIITGYNFHNVFVHDILGNVKNRKISRKAFLAAWKNSGFNTIIIKK